MICGQKEALAGCQTLIVFSTLRATLEYLSNEHRLIWRAVNPPERSMLTIYRRWPTEDSSGTTSASSLTGPCPTRGSESSGTSQPSPKAVAGDCEVIDEKALRPFNSSASSRTPDETPQRDERGNWERYFRPRACIRANEFSERCELTDRDHFLSPPPSCQVHRLLRRQDWQ